MRVFTRGALAVVSAVGLCHVASAGSAGAGVISNITSNTNTGRPYELTLAGAVVIGPAPP
jgi:hypothetical protein